MVVADNKTLKGRLTMSEDMLGKVLVRELPGLMRDFMKKLLGENGQEWVAAFKLFLRKQNPWPEQAQAIARKLSALLDSLKTVIDFPGVDDFKVAEYLKITPEGEKATAELVIGYLGDNLRNNFLGKVEKDIAPTKLRAYRLKKDSVDGPIIDDLGGKEAAETTVAEMVDLMKRQGRGQKGILLTNGYANIFYIKDINGQMWAVRCRWDSDGRYWLVAAYSVTDPFKWLAGRRVVSR